MAHLPTIVRLSKCCPFADVQEACNKFLQQVSQYIKLPDLSLLHGPSDFVTQDAVPALISDNPEVKRLFEELFLLTGRVSHLERLLGWHPKYLQSFSETYSFIMREDGPLPHCWRNYLAILAASRYQCDYLVDLQEQDFLFNEGDPKWLEGLKYCPKKLQDIALLNARLAHQPWTIETSDITHLVKGEDLWSVNELMHAIIILTTFHALAGLVYGLGLTPEFDAQLSHKYDIPRSEEATEEKDTHDSEHSASKIVELLEGTLKKQLESAATTVTLDAFAVAEKAETVETKLDEKNHVHFSAKYLDPPMKYVDFDVRSDKYQVFRTHDFRWKEQGYAIVNRFYVGVAPLLDREFDLIYSLTYNSINRKENVDTTLFRNSIWHYTNRLFGVCFDDYDYRQINILLNKTIKSYVKKVACHPETVSIKDFMSFGVDLQPDEKCHVAILAMEARRLSCLLHGLQAILKHMKQ